MDLIWIFQGWPKRALCVQHRRHSSGGSFEASQSRNGSVRRRVKDIHHARNYHQCHFRQRMVRQQNQGVLFVQTCIEQAHVFVKGFISTFTDPGSVKITIICRRPKYSPPC